MTSAARRTETTTGMIDKSSENGKDQKVLTATITPRILEHGKFFRGGVASEFHDLKYSQGMAQFSKEIRDTFPISLSNPVHTVTFGYWSFRPQLIGFVQAMNLTENQFGRSATNRPFVQERFGLINPKILADIYAGGIRPLASALVDSNPGEKPYLLQTYDAVAGQTDEAWLIKTNINSLWQVHQNEKYRQLAILTTEAVLAKQRARIGNPVVLEHAGELTPIAAHLIDTINVLSLAMDPSITTISAISNASMENYANADLVIRDTSVPLKTSLYPSYIVNRIGKGEEILPGYSSTPPFKPTPRVKELYENLHGNVNSWVENHQSALKRT